MVNSLGFDLHDNQVSQWQHHATCTSLPSHLFVRCRVLACFRVGALSRRRASNTAEDTARARAVSTASQLTSCTSRCAPRAASAMAPESHVSPRIANLRPPAAGPMTCGLAGSSLRGKDRRNGASRARWCVCVATGGLVWLSRVCKLTWSRLAVRRPCHPSTSPEAPRRAALPGPSVPP